MEQHKQLSLVLFSADNPDATFLTAGLLHNRPAILSEIVLQNIDEPRPSQEVLVALQEIGTTFGGWQPAIVARDAPQGVAVGITLCVLT